MKFESLQQVEKFARDNDRVLVLNGDEVLDVTTFAKHHPGGASLIHRYQNKDLAHELKTHYTLTYRLADSLAIGSFSREIRKIIDPEKAIMPQIWNLNHQQYLHIVESPHWLFVDSPRMFQSNFFEFLSHNKWYSIVIVQFLIMYFTTGSLNLKLFTFTEFLLSFFFGFFLFTLVEYLMHRFLFHSEKHLLDNKIMRYVHFIIHGIHHMLPSDPDRLVLPPSIGCIYIFFIWYIFKKLEYMGVSQQIIYVVRVGLQFGYLAYDLTHYALHHIGKQRGYFGQLQRYHNQHHFSGEDAGYGVSSKFWDVIFGTLFCKDEKHKQQVTDKPKITETPIEKSS